LIVNGQVVESTAGSQVFYSPELEPDMDYHYTILVQISRDGQTTEQTRTVDVRAGQEFSVDFDPPVIVTYAEE
jgi:uncharacterized protein (TIGR03000 family)